MSNKKIEDIEGIGPSYGERLRAAHVEDTESLLKSGCSKYGRQNLARETGINEGMILKWVNMADLCRIKGVGQEYSELLEAAGVDTVRELRNRNPHNLVERMTVVNDEKHLTRRVPTEKEIVRWVGQAQELPVLVEY